MCPYDIGADLLLARRHIALGSCMPCAHRVANQACGLNDCAACGLNDCACMARETVCLSRTTSAEKSNRAKTNRFTCVTHHAKRSPRRGVTRAPYDYHYSRSSPNWSKSDQFDSILLQETTIFDNFQLPRHRAEPQQGRTAGKRCNGTPW